MDKSHLWTALRDVEDPEFLVSIVDMGLVVDVQEGEGIVTVKLTFTAMGCPATDMIIEDVRARLMAHPNILAVNIEVVWDPIWTTERLSSDGKLALLEMGIAV